MNVKEAVDYLNDISKELATYSNNDKALLAKVNSLSKEELSKLEKDHAKLTGPVKLLRLICIKKLLNANSKTPVATPEEIELIKENLKKHKVDEYDFLTMPQKRAIKENIKEKSFHQWNKYLKLLFPLLYSYETKQGVYVALQVIRDDILRKLDLTDWICERTQKPKVYNYWGFEGANQYGDDRAVLMLRPKEIQDHRDAIQLVLYFHDGQIEAGLDSGSNFKLTRTRDLDKFSTYEGALDKLKKVKDRALALNKIIIAKSNISTLRFKSTKMEPDSNIENDTFILKKTINNSFFLYYRKEDGEILKLGDLKIIKQNMNDSNIDIPNSFAQLDDDHCSLGDQGYYEALQELEERQRNSILNALRDYVYDGSIYKKFEKSNERKNYLTNKTSESQLKNYKNILYKEARPTPYNFSFTITDKNAKVEVDVVPDSLPPTNIHALIGGNGTGKTQLLIAMANDILKNKKATMMKGKFEYGQNNKTFFSNLVTVAFSTLDSFVPLLQDTDSKIKIGYDYIGLKNPKINESNHDFKKIDDLNNEFQKSIHNCSNFKLERWTKIIELLNTDMRFKELDLCNLIQENKFDKIVECFRTLSSGHKIILFTLTKLVELVNSKTLVLIDEPENHLHPPLLAVFIKAISQLLRERNGVAIVATHSPVVLQEIPKSCISIIRRYGEEIRITRPHLETFGESVGILTNLAFGLEVKESGYLKILNEKIEDKRSYEDIMKEFNNQIGGEGRAILRTLLATNSGECNA